MSTPVAQNVIIAQNLGKKFYRYPTSRPTTLFEALIRGLRGLKPKDVFWGVDHIDFSITSGQIVGIVGKNGAGKSTLLRMIGGVTRPDDGSIVVHGQVGGFLDLTAGLRNDLTGRENIYISGVISGLTRQEVQSRFDDIVSFAEIHDFLDNPLRTYSTGMRLRLAFAVAAHTAPDILLIDEVLAVGDALFRDKCFDRIEQFKAEGTTIIIVSHQMSQIRRLCDTVLWLKNGRLMQMGVSEAVIAAYEADMQTEIQRRTLTSLANDTMEPALRLQETRFGSQEMQMTAVSLQNRNGQPIANLEAGSSLRVEIEFHAPNPIASPVFGVTIKQNKKPVLRLNSKSGGMELPMVVGNGRIALYIERVDLATGNYFVDVGVHEQNWAYTYDFHTAVYPLHIHSEQNGKFLYQPPHQWHINL